MTRKRADFEAKRQATHDTAMAIIASETAVRDAKTSKLRALREACDVPSAAKSVKRSRKISNAGSHSPHQD